MIDFHASCILCFLFILSSIQPTLGDNESNGEISKSFTDGWRRRRTVADNQVEEANQHHNKYNAGELGKKKIFLFFL